MWLILMTAMLIGPNPSKDTRPPITIYVDVDSKDLDIARRSKIVIDELKRPMRFMTIEQTFIISNYNIEVKDAYRHGIYHHVPCLKHSKNAPALIFPQGTFAASGSFTSVLYAHLKWDKHEKDCERFLEAYEIKMHYREFLRNIDIRQLVQGDPDYPREPTVKDPNLEVMPQLDQTAQ